VAPKSAAGEFIMKYKVACWFAIAAVCACLATAQNSKVQSSTSRPAPDPLQSVTKPLTEKSATPPHHTSSALPPPRPASSAKTSDELTRLERQNVAAKGPKSGSASAPKAPPASKPADTSAGNGSGINFKYQKPAGGMEASTPNAHAANTNARVTKKN
jgi:hypothetical protein